MIVEDPALGQDAIKESGIGLLQLRRKSAHGFHACAIRFPPLAAQGRFRLKSADRAPDRSIRLAMVRLLERLLYRFCLQGDQRTLQATIDISEAFALKRSDFGDGPASSNPPKAGLLTWRKHPFLHDKVAFTCGVVGGRHGADRPHRILGRSQRGDAPRKRAAAGIWSAAAKLPREEAGNWKSLLLAFNVML